MSRLLPYPLFSGSLLIMWLVLNASLTLSDIFLGIGLGLAGGIVLGNLQPPLNGLRRRASTATVLVLVIFIDIVRSNLAVAKIVLHPTIHGRTSGFLSMPLALRHPGGLAVLACIITATPGTSWARYDAAQNVVTIHVLDLIDEQAWIKQFKDRYERRLLEIFQ